MAAQPPRVNKHSNRSVVLSVTTAIEEFPQESYKAAQSSVLVTQEWLTSVIQDCKNKMMRIASHPSRVASMTNKVTKGETISLPDAVQSATHENKSSVMSFSSSYEESGTLDSFTFPDETLDHVNSMKVKDLRDELRNRGLDEYGLKKDLRARLLADIKREYCQQDGSASKSGYSESNTESIIDPKESRCDTKHVVSTDSSTTAHNSVATSVSTACTSKDGNDEKSNKGLPPVYETLAPEQQQSPDENIIKTAAASVPVATADTQTNVEKIDEQSTKEDSEHDVKSENGSSLKESADKNQTFGSNGKEVESYNGGVERAAAAAKDGQQTVNDEVVMIDTSRSSDCNVKEGSEVITSTKKDEHGQSYTKEGTEDRPIQVKDVADQASGSSSTRKNSVVSSPGQSSSSSDRKRLRSPMRSLVQSAVQKFSPAPKVARLAAKLEKTTLENDVPAKQVITGAEHKLSGQDKMKDLQSNKHIDTTPEQENEVMQLSCQKPTVTQSHSMLQATTTASCHQIACSQPQQSQEQDARKAKIAEMREKSKPVVASKPLVPTLGYGNVMQSLKNKGEVDGKKKLLAHKMREKALKNLEANTQSTTAMLAKTFEPPKLPMLASTSVSNTKTTFGSAATGNKVKSMFATTSAFKSGVFSPGKVAPAPPAQKPPTPPAPPESPMSTYEMSDYDSECDSDDESAASDRGDKNIPTWAQRPNLLAALNVQFKNPDLDPDEIFGEILTCDLQAIFNKKKQRYQRRTSSGCWTKDKATAHEKLAYKRSIKIQVVGHS